MEDVADVLEFFGKFGESFCGKFVFAGMSPALGGVEDGVKEGFARDVFLIEEAAFFRRPGFVGDADMLGDFAGGGDKV